MPKYQSVLSGLFLVACIIVTACSQQAPSVPTAAPSVPTAAPSAPTTAPSAPTAAPTSGSEQRLIYFFGLLTDKGTITLEPWETFTDKAAVPDTKGPLMVQALDATGAVVATQAFTVNFALPDNPPMTEAPFDGVIRFPTTTTKFQILKDSKVLQEVAVSKNAPVVADIGPITAGASVDGKSTITWTASDADNDKLTYTLEYNPDVSNDQSAWEVLASSLTKPEFSIDFGELPGGQHAQLQVAASDGVLTTYAESAEFVVAPKPPAVEILPPIDGLNYPEKDNEVALQADVFDPQEIDLPDEKVEWSSSISGKLGTGTEIYVSDLPKGEHTITVKATNSAGLSSSATVNIVVGNVSESYIAFPPERAETTLEQEYSGLTSSVVIPSSAVVTETVVMLSTSKQPPQATAPQGFTFAEHNISLKAEVVDGESWIATDFTAQTPVQVTLKYAAELPGGINPESLRLFRWEQKIGANGEESGDWVDAATECPTAGEYDYSTPGQVSVPVCRFGEFALVGTP